MKPLQDGLEGILEVGAMPESGSALGILLEANPPARQEVADMLEISRLIRDNFKVSPAEAEAVSPAPGFYARVLARIEAETPAPSIWDFFLEPLGKRLVYASLALAGLLFAATFFDDASGTAQPQVAGTSPALHGAVLASDGDDTPLVESANPDEDRGATLVQLTTYSQ